jgi:DNA replication and repair protein RecF
LYVSKLQLRNFRNYQELDLSPGPRPLLFIGENAQGKSNLLEAVYMLATARSVRASADIEMIGWEGEKEPQPVARVAGAVERSAGAVLLEAVIVGPALSLSGQSTRAGKRFRVNGIPRRAIDLIGNLRAVLFTAEDMAIVTGSPSDRRRYLDLSITQLDRRYYAASQRYARILQQRNAGLKRVKEGLASVDELAFWDDSLAREGAVIVSFRFRHAARLSALAKTAHADLSGEASEHLEVRYEPRLEGDWRDLTPASSLPDVESVLHASLRVLHRREVAAGMSLAGPHRDELAINLNGVPAAS